MSSCERCWARSYDPHGNQSERYQENIATHACTPQEQAGPDAEKCLQCGRMSLHQFTREPMCGCPAVKP